MMRVTAVIRVTVGAGGDVNDFEVSEERTQLFNDWDVIPRLHLPIIIWFSTRACERVNGGLSAHFLKGRLDVGVDEGDRIIRVLVLRGQIMEHVEQLRASRGTILKDTCALHKIGICGCEVFVSRISRIILDEPRLIRIDPHRRGRRPPSFLRKAIKRHPTSSGRN
jgi:hypothetical protein